MEIIVATQSKPSKGEIARIITLFEHGLDTLHVRRSKSSSVEVEEFILSIPKHFHSKIVIHGHYDLAKKYKLKGVHIRRKHRSPSRKNRFKRFMLKLKMPKMVMCATFQSIQSLRDKGSEYFDYVILNKIFSSADLLGNELYSLKLLKSVISKSSVKVYAMGKINKERKAHLIEAGFAGVILSSAIFRSEDDQFLKEYAAFALD